MERYEVILTDRQKYVKVLQNIPAKDHDEAMRLAEIRFARWELKAQEAKKLS
jgi:hypothetical protein